MLDAKSAASVDADVEKLDLVEVCGSTVGQRCVAAQVFDAAQQGLVTCDVSHVPPDHILQRLCQLQHRNIRFDSPGLMMVYIVASMLQSMMFASGVQSC